MTSTRRFLVPVARLGNTGQNFQLVASAEERAALAARFDLLALDRLEAALSAGRTAAGVRVTGAFEADVLQACVVSGEPVPARIRAAVDLRFEPEAPSEAEVELEPEALDVLPLEGDTVDLGEAVAQSLALALDPYPRADAEVLAAARRHLMREEEAEAAEVASPRRTPFADLLRKPD